MIAALTALLLAAQAAPAAKPAAAKPPSMSFQPKTMVEAGALQVVLGERAVFHLQNGAPVVDQVEKGKLAIAHPEGAVTETFAAPGDGKLAAALDGSAEKRASSLKIWNGTAEPVSYRAVVLVLKGPQTVEPRPVLVCSVKPGETWVETWPAPVVAVGMSAFKTGAGENKPCPPPAAVAKAPAK
ncbi:hypothetical protein [Phenylobacterium deserti]|uniref:Uncharacterized protein n=1 Tax=Phenylobacterium deserti TaxID=1914756 RepID=A0A328AV04_9CAUL|nr:hypothetical protein [Phenylobacterium deserti]RAK58001.1 hypothetical protein DJ018_08860 [Phenylobacterium deserti]